MKSIFDNLILSIAIAISVMLHGIVLLLHFVAPRTVDTPAADPGLEVILVNAKHDKKPIKAQALAQADLDGGGANDEGRSKSPLPDMRITENGENVTVARKKIEVLEENQRKLMDQVRKKTNFSSQQSNEKNQFVEEQSIANGQEKVESLKALARMAAEISQTIEDQNKRPRKTFITPSTQAVGYAMYYKSLQDRVEKTGTLDFPQQDGKKLYGELVIYIPVYQDGTIYERDGGPRVERSSNNLALDRAALRIVRRAAPFGKFPPNMRSTDKDDVWEIITRFRFTREDALQTESRGVLK